MNNAVDLKLNDNWGTIDENNNQYFIEETKKLEDSIDRISAHDLFSLFTAHIIEDQQVFIR